METETVPLEKSYFFRNFTTDGKITGVVPDLIGDKTARMFNKRRYNFYTQLINALTNPKTKDIVEKLFSLEFNNRSRQERVQNISKDIANSLAVLQYNSNDGEFEKHRDEINRELLNDPALQKAVQLVDPSTQQKGGGDPSSYYSDMLDSADPATTVLNKYKYDATKSPDNEKITLTDRVVFIAVTFVIRGLSLFVVQWAFNSYMVTTFQQALFLYVGSYLGIFLLWVLLTNAADNVFLFRMLFYYISTTPHGYGRIIVHILIHLLLLPIPSIVDNTQNGAPPFTFEQGRKMYTAVARLSMFLWLFGVVVAMNY